jgi:SAM-dependent methyltransferase
VDPRFAKYPPLPVLACAGFQPLPAEGLSGGSTAAPTTRFTTRVEHYVRSRPGYPPEIVATLVNECGLTPTARVVDVGSGTGLLAERFLEHGNRVIGIEPNRAMREAGDRRLGGNRRFQSVGGEAEAIPLADGSADFITAGQAFHWFDRRRARGEFARVLTPAGWVVLAWNERDTESTAFLAAYERLLLRFAVDYQRVDHRQIEEAHIEAFFGGTVSRGVFGNRQPFDYDGLQSRLLSSSYTPEPGHVAYEPMLEELSRIFAEYQDGGRVVFEYATKAYWGRFPRRAQDGALD